MGDTIQMTAMPVMIILRIQTEISSNRESTFKIDVAGYQEESSLVAV